MGNAKQNRKRIGANLHRRIHSMLYSIRSTSLTTNEMFEVNKFAASVKASMF